MIVPAFPLFFLSFRSPFHFIFVYQPTGYDGPFERVARWGNYNPILGLSLRLVIWGLWIRCTPPRHNLTVPETVTLHLAAAPLRLLRCTPCYYVLPLAFLYSKPCVHFPQPSLVSLLRCANSALSMSTLRPHHLMMMMMMTAA